MVKQCLIAMSVFLMWGCAESSQEAIPACIKAYSGKGNSEALDELVEEYQKTIELVSAKDDIFLIKDIQNINGDFIKMEDWVCRAQKKYGRH